MIRLAQLTDRGVLAISGDDARGFLQGLISNDARAIQPDRAISAALLTPQGKYLHDFRLVEQDGAILLEGEADRLDDLAQRLNRYRLRAKVTITPRADWTVAAAWGLDAAQACGLGGERGAARPFGAGVAFIDPRLAELGVRILAPHGAPLPSGATVSLQAYARHRVATGVPEGARDLLVEKSILLECGFDELAGVDWQKGCYVGQELTARTKYRGLIKKRLLPVAIAGEAPEPGAIVTLDGTEAGEIRSVYPALEPEREVLGLALLRIENLDALSLAGTVLEAGGARIRVHRPAWMRF